jgi:hypothetical protein
MVDFLLSGSLHYKNSIVSSDTGSNRVVVVLDHHFYGRLRNGHPSGLPFSTSRGLVRWTRIRHESVGGTSQFMALFCSTANLDPNALVLSRTLYHIVDHAVRPMCIQESDTRFGSFLTIQDWSHPFNFQSQLVYSAHFYCSGWGYRCLTLGELAQVFGLAMICRSEELRSEYFQHLIPAQLFHTLKDEMCIDIQCTNSPLVPQPPPFCLRLFKFPCATWSWIRPVGRWLSHEWIDTTKVTSKAAKRDDASIAIDMWKKLLLLLYPACLSRHLDALRTWILRWIQRHILRGLRSYLGLSYGTTWVSLLLAARQRLVQNKDIGDNVCSQGGFAQSAQHQRLVLEAERGADVISRFTESTWWEWTRGSALVFWR